jgi:hypothetical protein
VSARSLPCGDARVAVVVSSSDNTVDVFKRVFPAIEKFWPDCPYEVYVGLNAQQSPFATPRVLRAEPAEWRKELASQLRQVPQEWVILVLDDFLFLAAADQPRLGALVQRCLEQDWPYLRLIPLDRPLLARWVHKLTRPRSQVVETIPRGYPYYSSLQVALWRKTHLLQSLEAARGIWDFEHLESAAELHRAVVGTACLKYRHVVEKGRWLPDAAALLTRAGLESALGTRNSWPSRVFWQQRIGRWRFQLTGYAVMKLKRKLRAWRQEHDVNATTLR